jgi:hypothetical protein
MAFAFRKQVRLRALETLEAIFSYQVTTRGSKTGDYLAKTTSRAHQEQPGLVGQLFGGSGSGGGHAGGSTGGGMLSSPLAKGVLGGIAAYGL